MLVLYVETVSKNNSNSLMSRDFYGPFESMENAQICQNLVKEQIANKGLRKITVCVIAALKA